MATFRQGDWDPNAYYGLCLARAEDRMDSIATSKDKKGKVPLIDKSPAPYPSKAVSKTVISRLNRYFEKPVREGLKIWFTRRNISPTEVEIEMNWSKKEAKVSDSNKD